jgi:hypothetical protein
VPIGTGLEESRSGAESGEWRVATVLDESLARASGIVGLEQS